MPPNEEILNLQQRLNKLEEVNYFQETALESLNEALTSQQRQLDVLTKRLTDAEEKLRMLHSLLDSQGGEATTPPHSVPGLY